MNLQEGDRPTAGDPRGDTPPFQFTVRSLLILMFLWAAILALIKLAVPTARVRWGLLVAAYFMTLATYVVLRAPYLWRRVRRAIQQRQEVLEERRQLAAMADRRKERP
jgi:hypothetical protein